jgi:hypothetical protein
MTSNDRRGQIPIAGEADVAPWGSLIGEVRRSGHRVAWLDDRVEAEVRAEADLAAQEHDWDADKFRYARLAQSRELREWVKLSREERAHGAQVARAAVSAGLSEKYISSVQAEGMMIARTLQRALQAADLTDEQWAAATTELRVALAEVGRGLMDRAEIES